MSSMVEGWLESIGWGAWHLEAIAGDASLRRYYRLTLESQYYILMDSSQQREALEQFVQMAQRLLEAGVRVPRIIEVGGAEGYLILEDFGHLHLYDQLSSDTYTALYQEAIETLLVMQQTSIEGLLPYDRGFLLEEMGLMESWYLNRYLARTLSSEEQSSLRAVCETIADTVLTQPQGYFVHRDFHSRNIMVTPRGALGVIDFQDARVGAVTYDLVSLLKDVYCLYTREEIERLALYYRDRRGLTVSDATFLEWFDFMGLQRHLKILGIFARLALRDDKPHYLAYLPQTLSSILSTAQRYPQVAGLVKLLEGGVSVPATQ